MAQQYPFVYYTPRDGLVNSRVRSIKQDSKGRMYFCTYGGLSVYDGVRFTNYNQLNGLANELVNDVIEIGPDSILIATNAGHLNTLVKGKIGTYPSSDSTDHIINRFLKSKDGTLYASADDGLFIIEKTRFRKIPLMDQNGKDIGTNLNRMNEWKNYLLITPWNFKQKEKVIIYDNEKQVVAGIIAEEIIANTAVTPQGDLWLSDDDGLKKLDLPSLQKGKILLTPVTSLKNASQFKNEDIYFDSKGEAWFYKNNEVIHILPSGKIQSITVAQDLKASRIADFMVDKEGIIWMASDGNGVVKMPGTDVQILGDLIPGIRNNIRVLIQKSDTTWLFNNTDHSFYRITHGQITAFPLKDESLLVINMYIRGETLCFNADHKIYSIEHKDQALSYLRPVLIFPHHSPILEIGAITVTRDDFIIQYVRENISSFTMYVIKNNNIVMKLKLSFALDQLSIDPNGSLWLTTRDHRLMEYSLHPETPDQYIQLKHDYSAFIEEIGPRSIALDTFGNVWIGTRNNGIYRYQFKDKKLQSTLHFTTLQGLTDNFYYYLFCDQDNNLWAGSQTGLDKISLKGDQYIIENITKSKNIFQGVYNIVRPAEDAIWALTSSGEIIMISSHDPPNVIVTPSFFITSLTVNDKENDATFTHFWHDENNLSIRVAAPSFTDEKSIMYSYQLEGSGNTNWSKPSNNALFNFINLSPGAYTLRIKAAFPAAMYPPQIVTYAFTIKPPYWQTWWFLTLAAFVAIGILGSMLRFYYVRKLEKQRIVLEKKQVIEKERTRIATDMHDDLGAGLSRIKFLSETIGLKQQQHLPIEDEIVSIRHYSHEMIDKMGEIVWALNEKNDSLRDLLSYTRAYAMEYLAENGLQSQIDKLPPHKTMMVNSEFRRNIYLSVKETLHNVIKHANASHVTIHFQIVDKLVIVIQDDGIGIDLEPIHRNGNGLINIRKRMAEIGGDLQVIKDHGTRILLTAPLPS